MLHKYNLVTRKRFILYFYFFIFLINNNKDHLLCGFNYKSEIDMLLTIIQTLDLFDYLLKMFVHI